MAVAGDVVINFKAELGQFEQRMSALRGQLARAGETATAASQNFGALEHPLIRIGLHAAGLDRHFIRLVSTMGMLTVGGGVTVGIAVAAGVIGTAIEKLTEKTRKLKEEVEKFVTAMEHAAALKADPFVDLRTSADKARERIRQLVEANRRDMESGNRALVAAQIARRNEEIARLTRAIDEAEFERRQGAARRELDEEQRRREGTQRFLKEQEEARRKTVEGLTDLVASGRARPEDIRRLEAIGIAHARALAQSNLQLERRVQLQKELLKIQEAFRALPSSNLGALLDLTREGASAAAQQTQVMAAAQAGASLAMQGVGGERGRSPFREWVEQQRSLADLYRETWQNAVRGVQDAFAQLFENLFTEGNALRNFLVGVARAIQSAFANLFAAEITNLIGRGLGLTSVIPGLSVAMTPASGGAGPSVPLTGRVASTEPAVVIAPTVNFTVSALTSQDASAALLAHGPTIATAVVREVERSQAVRRALLGGR